MPVRAIRKKTKGGERVAKGRAVLYVPPYYDAFQCLAERCRHSCCIGWDIGIDARTQDKYRAHEELMATVEVCDGQSCFRLTADGRCPHLDAQGLCRIIRRYGEGYLSDICRRHPRFYHVTAQGRVEAGLGPVCEEACRLLLTDPRPFVLAPSKVSTDDDVPQDMLSEVPSFDVLPHRARIWALIAEDVCFDTTAATLRAAFDVPAMYDREGGLRQLMQLDILDPTWQTQLSRACERVPRTCGRWDMYYARLLRYFVFRHVSEAQQYDDLRARLGFALLSVEMIRALFEAESSQTLTVLSDIVRRYSSEIEYSQDNTDELIFAFACAL